MSGSVLVALLMMTLPAKAETIVTASEFQAMSEGHTLSFTQNGLPYGVEQFYPERRSTWRYADGMCTEGQWFQQGDAFCFRYAAETDVQCWIFSRRGKDYYARILGLPEGDPSELRLSQISDKPIGCPAPDLGV